MADKHVKVEISATDRASQVLRGLGREADSLKGRLANLRGSFGSLSAGLGAGALGALGGGIAFSSAMNQAADFETALFETSKVTDRNLDDIKRQMLTLPSSLGSMTELTTGYYNVLSAGISDVAESQETLVTASKLAKAAGVSQAESIEALTKMMAGYRGELKSTAQAADLLMDIEDFGQASVRQLVPIIGDLAGVSQIAAVQYKEMAAAMSLLTQTAGSPSQAATQYRAMVMELLKPNEQMIKLINALGEKSGVDLIRKNGLMGALSLIAQGAKASGQELSRFVGSVEALTGMSAISASAFKTYADILDQIGSKADRTEESYQRWLKTFRGVESQALATGENLMIAFGEGFLPVIKEGLKEFTVYLEENRGKISGWGQSTAEAVTTITQKVGSLVDFCSSIPIDGLEYGVIGALLFGKKGAILGLFAEAFDVLYTTADGLDHVVAGKLSFSEVMAAGSRDEMKKLLKQADKNSKPSAPSPSLASSHEALPLIPAPTLVPSHGALPSSPQQSGDSPSLPKLPKTFEPVKPKGEKKGGKSEAEKAAEQAYKASDALRAMDLSIAKLTGDSKTVKQLELADTIADWEKKFADLKVPADVAREKIQQLTKASEKATTIKDAQAAAEFYKELAILAGDFGAAQEYSNQLIELQAENLRQNVGVSEEYIAKWVELQKLQNARDPLSGLQRGLVTFGSQYGDLAAQVENTTVSMGSTIANTLSEAFMKGKLSAADFFNSLLSMAAQAMSNYFVGQMFSGIGAMFSVGNNSGSLPVIGGPSGGGVVPGYIHHAGGLVGSGSGPTRPVPMSLFSDAPRYHNGSYPWLSPDEVAIIAQRGERVLNRGQAAAFDAVARMPQAYGFPQAYMSSVSPVTNNITITPPAGYEANEQRSRNSSGGDDLRVTFSRMMAAEVGAYGSPVNKALRGQGMRTPVVRQG